MTINKPEVLQQHKNDRAKALEALAREIVILQQKRIDDAEEALKKRKEEAEKFVNDFNADPEKPFEGVSFGAMGVNLDQAVSDIIAGKPGVASDVASTLIHQGGRRF